MDEFDFAGFLWRLLFAVALVLLTFNPTGHSYYHWLADGFPSVQPTEAIAGILLLIGWLFSCAPRSLPSARSASC